MSEKDIFRFVTERIPELDYIMFRNAMFHAFVTVNYGIIIQNKETGQGMYMNKSMINLMFPSMFDFKAKLLLCQLLGCPDLIICTIDFSLFESGKRDATLLMSCDHFTRGCRKERKSNYDSCTDDQ